MESPAVITPLYLDKAFWMAVLTPLILIVNSEFGTQLDAAALVACVLPAVAFIVGHKWSSTQKALAVYEMKPPEKVAEQLNK